MDKYTVYKTDMQVLEGGEDIPLLKMLKTMIQKMFGNPEFCNKSYKFNLLDPGLHWLTITITIDKGSNTPGPKVGPGFHDRKLVVKIRKKHQKISLRNFVFNKKMFFYIFILVRSKLKISFLGISEVDEKQWVEKKKKKEEERKVSVSNGPNQFHSTLCWQQQFYLDFP